MAGFVKLDQSSGACKLSYNPDEIMVVFALENEACGRFQGVNLCFTGVGKVNAAYGLMRGLEDWRYERQRPPALVVNLGSAGSTSHRAGTVVNCTQFIQRDMDVTPLGFKPYQTPFDDTPVPLAGGAQIPGLPQACCGSGDSFVTDGQVQAWQVMDMEAYALARICNREKLRFCCLKFITDGADGKAAADWEQALMNGAIKLREAYELLLNHDILFPAG